MTLVSRFLSKDDKLQAARIRDSAHILKGASGDHVAKIQTALALLDNARIAVQEINDKSFGPSTADAVLAYKRKRRIINFTYQSQADSIVGKMTITVLDAEMMQLEIQSLSRNSCAGKQTRQVFV